MKTYQGRIEIVETENTRIEKEVLIKAREYCKKNGLKLTWFVSRAIEKELKEKNK